MPIIRGKKETNKRVLVVAAHPDDEMLGCGGTIARHAREEDEVHILILAEGLTSRDKVRDPSARKSSLTALKKQAASTARLLGAISCRLLDFPDNRMDSVDLLDIIKAVEKEATRIEPHLVYTHHWGDLNIDHRITSEAVVTAFRPGTRFGGCCMYAFEVLSSSEWSFGATGSPFQPNHFVDITQTIDKKLEAMELYGSELRKYPHPRSQEAIRALAMRRGSQAGLETAEAFQLVRSIV